MSRPTSLRSSKDSPSIHSRTGRFERGFIRRRRELLGSVGSRFIVPTAAHIVTDCFAARSPKPRKDWPSFQPFWGCDAAALDDRPHVTECVSGLFHASLYAGRVALAPARHSRLSGLGD